MKYAADIVLIPPLPIAERIVQSNNEDFTKQQTSVRLGFEDYVPHLSLVMGIIDTGNEKKVIDEINNIVSSIAKIELAVAHTNNPWITISRTKELMELHTVLMEKVYAVFERGGTTEMYHRTDPGEIIDPSILTWINEFDSKYSLDNFNPHITSWTKSEKERDQMPKTFTSSTLALYHLGNYNTCRRLIHSWQLT
jgi:hypothetical protein